ncbi:MULTISPECIES: 5-dehydro-2-deoxygluconokinase [unclassified Modicisalibacter]|uniref:bifunctional 5-dehydro-2-deoxygluconokinase/5-dehydro-2- deoxyphosphogluconate aldolase n=1 Tax=unclassified Modicisalibacter TaxID=2679913 RepID=UPI001CC8F9C2|nr:MULTISPECIES: 5-dehydro-2-deoxygluconokinase [unclassified Modicisalibacter]MBZ9559393.1 5-dehydro-2-deoxygluconokinase [Modicisalibacter sp. R2A 31.J]MBZ9576442.1 5-dehydro-2-deoxygluconokinase [Modicisalibacter sp. MOD 31.J]
MLESSKDPHALDLICLGRVAVDLYSQQIGSRLEDVSSFAKYLGGSSGNMAYGTARLGLRSAMLSRVGNEQLGNFVREELGRAGVDVSALQTDPDRHTALAILAIKDRDTFPLLFYRRDCADMAVDAEAIDPAFIARTKALAITGTHLSTETTQRACRKALDAAAEHGVKRILDIDYRPVLWGLTPPGDGETRFVADEQVTRHLQRWLADFDLIVGTEEEFHIAGGSTDTLASLRRVREFSDATLVCKLGALGCVIIEGAIPDQLADGILIEGVEVEVLNVLGAGDAFMSGLLRGWLRGESWATSASYANACGALVVSRHGCAPAMPTEEELFDYLSRRETLERPDRDARLNHLHRVTTRVPIEWPQVCGLAFDHRRQLTDMAREVKADPARLSLLKQLLVKAAEEGARRTGLATPAILVDDIFGQDALNDATGKQWWIGRPVELPGSRPLRFQHGDDLGSQLRHWPREHIIKCLVFYHPDDPLSLRLEQEARLRQLYQAACASGLELLIEVIPPDPSDIDDRTLARSLTRLYNLGIRPDWWKLPAMPDAAWAAVSRVIDAQDPHCRGVVLLGLDAPMEAMKRGFAAAATHRRCKGFTVGRTLFAGPSREWLAGVLDDTQLIDRVASNYAELIGEWQRLRATPAHVEGDLS